MVLSPANVSLKIFMLSALLPNLLTGMKRGRRLGTKSRKSLTGVMTSGRIFPTVSMSAMPSRPPIGWLAAIM